MMRRLWIIIKHTAKGFSDDNCTQHAAAISYYVLFSLVPLTIVVVAILGIFLDNQEVRDNIVDWVLEVVPLSDDEGRQAVTDIVASIQNLGATFAVVGVLISFWASLAVFSAVRRSLNGVWGTTEQRPWMEAKFVDMLQVGVVSAVLLGSIVLTGVIRAARELSGDFLGPLAGDSGLWEAPTAILPALLTFAAFVTLYRIVPAARPGVRIVVPGALLATVLFELLKNSFAFFIANFGNFDVVYGSLAGVMLFLFYMFISSTILLIGAEVVETLGRYNAGAFEDEINPPVPLPPITTRAFRAMRGIFVRD
jgi:membrane protein